MDLESIKKTIDSELELIQTQAELESLRIKYLGRKGIIAGLFDEMKSMPEQSRPALGKELNILKLSVEQKLSHKAAGLGKVITRQAQGIDITADAIKPNVGRVHILNQTLEEICSIFAKMGFEVIRGPEVETEFNNFTGLNIALEHPSRDAFDTFYIKSQVTSHKSQACDMQPATCGRLLLRSHTSPVQIRVMKARKPPLAVVVPGKVYRPDATDASHSFMFHQVEGFAVSDDIAFSDLKGVLTAFAKQLFGPDIKMRFRPHFFPFTEPSAEVDISCFICQAKGCSVCGRKGWLEILGAGMIHPNVFKNVGYPAGCYRGFAFGVGVERIAMLKCGIDDIRLFFENDLRFLRQF
jgi:phenylalanyl-tRNA synthetase alpha chain